MPIHRPMFRLLRRSGVATSYDRMRCLSSTSRSLLSFMASASPCRSPPALARRVFPLMVAPDPAVRRVSRYARLTDPTDCVILNGVCARHKPNRLLQIFSIKLAELTVAVGSVELYGYIAVRDGLDPLLNYVVNISRDDPIIVKQGSLINMVGPKRGIDMYSTILVEYDMRIKAGKVANGDHQLIDGVSALSDLQGTWNRAFRKRIDGDCGAVDLVLARIHDAVLANVEVVISEVQNSFNLCLRCFIGGYKKEIQFFDGAIGESRGLKRSVVAVAHGSTMDLNFEVASEPSDSAELCCSFKADTHRLATQEIKTEFGLISVKVAWSTLLSRRFVASA